jgi:hypothetical protein
VRWIGLAADGYEWSIHRQLQGRTEADKAAVDHGEAAAID